MQARVVVCKEGYAAVTTVFQGILPPGQIFFDEPMSAHTTFRVGGPADVFVEPDSVDQVRACIDAANDASVPWRMLGCGSNVLVCDAGVRGLVVHLGERFAGIDAEGDTLRVCAGATNETVADAALSAGLAGYEFACGIPGSVGGAAIMNAGAYDGQFADVGASVACLTSSGEVRSVSASEAQWGYRHSMMMERGYVVLEATLQLAQGDASEIRSRMDDLQERRAAKQPLELGSAGSTFKRPEGHFAGKLIQDAGMRGHTVGGAQVSEKHCGFVVNKGGATAADVLAVIRDVQEAVYAHSGVQLEPEVRIWD